jgi:hypothetical protein
MAVTEVLKAQMEVRSAAGRILKCVVGLKIEISIGNDRGECRRLEEKCCSNDISENEGSKRKRD